MNGVERMLNEALEHYRAGRYVEAIGCCAEVLETAPEQADALYVLGVCEHCMGRTEQARGAVERALALNPGNPHYYLTLGQILAAGGELERARSLYGRALEIDPAFPEVLNNLGALELDARRFGEAGRLFQRALEARPEFAEASCNLGVVAAEEGRPEEAIERYRQAIALRPDYPEAQNNLANVLSAMGEHAEAVTVLEALLARHPEFAIAHNGLGNALFSLGEPERARACFERALSIDPNFSEALGNVANALTRDGDTEQARSVYRRAMELDPKLPKVHFNYAMMLLGSGDYAAGWAEYEWRLQASNWLGGHAWFHRAGRLWDGKAAPGKRLLVRAEQGFGDVIQFVRFLPRVKALVAEVILEAPAPLRRLLESAPGVDRFVEAEPGRIEARGYDLFVPIMSLPHRLGVSLGTLPGADGYLKVAHPPAARLAEVLAGGGFKVGIVWAGSATHQDDRYRSCPAEAFQPLLGIEGVRLYSLQYGPRASEAPAGVVDLSGLIEDFADTAMVLEQLDLLISVDTAPVHLAGALGRPCWVLLAAHPDWRWLESGETTRWYERLTLFRQRRVGEWGEIINDVVNRLGERISVTHSIGVE